MDTSSAAPQSKQKNVTCAICQETLQKPHSLSCLHNFCGQCLKGLSRISEGGQRGVSCPECRTFTSELDIKKNPILEGLVEMIAGFYQERILNKDPMDKVCVQCDRRRTITSYCIECEAELCTTCSHSHLRLKTTSEHRVVPINEISSQPLVNISKFCPCHPSKTIRLSCVPCQLAICHECKIEKHDTHQTEDVSSALEEVLPEVRSTIPLLDGERNALIEVKGELVSSVRKATTLGRKILKEAGQRRDELISRAQRDYTLLEMKVSDFVHAVTKEGSLTEDTIDNSISSIDSMKSWLDVLVEMAQGSAVLYEVTNQDLLGRIRSLLGESRVSRDASEFRKKAARKPRFIQTVLQCDNILGTVQFRGPDVRSKQPLTKSVGDVSSRDNPATPNNPPHTPKQHSPKSVGDVTSRDNPATQYKSSHTPKHTTPTHTTKHKPQYTTLAGKSKVTASKPGSESLDTLPSFRLTERSLGKVKCKQHKAFSLKRKCYRLCYHNDLLWCPCYKNNTIDVYTLTGQLHRSVECSGVDTPRTLHPLTSHHMVLAAVSGLYMYDHTEGSVSTQLMEGMFRDVTVSDGHMVGLEESTKLGNRVHVFTTTDPPTHSHSFCVNHRYAVSVLVHQERLYVSAWSDQTSVSVYTLHGEVLRKYGRKGVGAPGEMSYPLLCTVGEDGVVVTDYGNHRLQVVTTQGQFSLVGGVDVEYPRDVVIVGGDMFVLHGMSAKTIQKYKLN